MPGGPAMLTRLTLLLSCLTPALLLLPRALSRPEQEQLFLKDLNVNPPHVSTDKSIKYDYDIVYVRAPRKGDRGRTIWTEIAHPALMDPGADLMLLHPGGTEERLVARGAAGPVTDPLVPLDGQCVYYAPLRGLNGPSQHAQPPFGGADIYEIHVRSQKIGRLTQQADTTNNAAADWSSDCRKPEKGQTFLNYGGLNLGPCPLPGGKIVFVSNRNAFRPPNLPSPCLQLFV